MKDIKELALKLKNKYKDNEEVLALLYLAEQHIILKEENQKLGFKNHDLGCENELLKEALRKITKASNEHTMIMIASDVLN